MRRGSTRSALLCLAMLLISAWTDDDERSYAGLGDIPWYYQSQSALPWYERSSPPDAGYEIRPDNDRSERQHDRRREPRTHNP